MAEAIAIATVAGAAVSAYGAYAQGEAANQAAQYNADLQARNATIAHQQGAAQAALVRRRAAQAQGAAEAAYGASGVSQEGSPLEVLASSAAQAKLDEETVLYQSNLQAMGFQANEQLDRTAGDTARRQAQLNAASSFLTGVGQAGSNYMYAQKGSTLTNSPTAQKSFLGGTR